jgi:hypothetical protein
MSEPAFDPAGLLAALEAALAAPDDAAALAHLAAARAALAASGLQLPQALAGAGPGMTAPTPDLGSPAPPARGPGVGFDPVTEDRLLIERVLALPGVSPALREELDGYREDIEAGRLTSADRRYLIALRQRLARSDSRTG